MNNLKVIYQNNPQAYLEVLSKLLKELQSYFDNVEMQYNSRQLAALKSTAHNIRNIAGSLGQSKLKIIAAYWEEVCAENKEGNIMELKEAVGDVLKFIQEELKTND